MNLLFLFLKANWKLVGGLAIAGFLYLQVVGAFHNYQDKAVEQQNIVTRMTAELTSAQIEAASAQATVQQMEVSFKYQKELYADALGKQDEIRAGFREEMKIFEDHDLQKLTNAKPGLIQPRINRGTQRIFDEIEVAFNRTQ